MPPQSRLSARTREPRDVAIRHLLDSIGEIGSVLETRSFSGLLLMMRLEIPTRAVSSLPGRLEAVRVPLEAASLETVRALESRTDDELDIVLDVTFVDGDANRREPVPVVPG